ncbi:MAG: hypothetical protein FJW91_00095 [Actinobacteria bacterium]|nr:hypothetical protein [Actinomycetota bacterium]
MRQGPQLEYLADGFHYYKSNYQMYSGDALKPDLRDQSPSNDLIDSVILVAKTNDFQVNAWAVYLHNSAIGMAHPETVVTNVFGNRFLSELCPANPQVAGYALGMTRDLCNLGIAGIRAESLHFHGARHGEHHERFFIELSQVSEFLFALCFCDHCKKNYQAEHSELGNLVQSVKSKLTHVFEDRDPWIGKKLSKELLAEIIGPNILDYLLTREKSVSNLYRKIKDITQELEVSFTFVDQAPLLDLDSANASQNSWQVGIDNSQIKQFVDRFAPLIYRRQSDQVVALTNDYLKNTANEINAILRPTFPDCTTFENLAAKVKNLVGLGVSEIDFYLLDTMRKRDLDNIRQVLN